MTLLDNVEQVLGAVSDLRELRNRLAELDEERRIIEEKIRSRLVQIAGAAADVPMAAPEHANFLVGRTTPLANARLASTERVLSTINSFGMRVVGAMDIAKEWGVDDESVVNSIRAALSRLTADKKIQKVGYGRYMALKGGATAA